MSDRPLIALRDVAAGYGRVAVWDDATLDIGRGEFVAVLGPNGSGKTTLLRILLGLLRPTAGTVSILGRPPRRGNPAIGYVPQRRPVDPELRLAGTELVKLGLTGSRWGTGLPRARRGLRRRVDEAVTAVGAEAYADHPIGTLSGGELQRLALAQTIVGDPADPAARRAAGQPRRPQPGGHRPPGRHAGQLPRHGRHAHRPRRQPPPAGAGSGDLCRPGQAHHRTTRRGHHLRPPLPALRRQRRSPARQPRPDVRGRSRRRGRTPPPPDRRAPADVDPC